ncbi:MAG: type I secretion system permease/ATPase [Burkholderiales bacterium]|nr:type I secretion system permease/ATPase [Burkholderiales bacterium]
MPAPDAGLLCLSILSRLHGIAAEPTQLAHELGLSGRAGVDDLLRAAKRLGLRAKAAPLDLARAADGKTPLPCLIELRSVSEGNTTFAVLAKLDREKALLHDPSQERPVVLPVTELVSRMTGPAVFIASRASLAAELARFDFSWFIPALVKYRKLVGQALIASVALQLFALITPLFFQVVMDKVLVHKGLSTLTVIGVALAATVLFESVLSALRTYVFAHTTSRIDVELGAKLYRHLLSLPLAYFEARRVGDSVARVRELEHIRQFLTGPALMSVIDAAFTVVFLAVMLFYSVTLTLIVLASIPLYGLLMWTVMPTLRRRLDERFSRGAENQAFLVESVTNIQTLKAGALEPVSSKRWDEQLAGYVASSFRVTRIAAFAGEGVQFIQKLVTVGILWLGAYEVMDGAMTIGALVAFNMLAGRVAQPILRLAQLWQDLQQTGISMARLADILDTKGENALTQGRAQLPPIQGDLRFDQVRFRYRPDGSEVLRGISFHLAPGQVLGLVGRSGSGKSTVAKLMQRLYVPERGRVLIDGVDLALADPTWLRRQIGVVLQENRLFARSIRDNIALADPGAPMEAVIEAAKLAGAHDFILELPEGYDTLVGEQGATLSGGQRQRIAIARALLTQPRILIFDEATSALDYESERIVQDNLRAMAKGRTVIVIAHRLSAVKDADRIIVLDHGEIVEEGTHTELIQKPLGRYARLHQMQAG